MVVFLELQVRAIVTLKHTQTAPSKLRECSAICRPSRAGELGMRQYCPDNVTMFSGHIVRYCNITIFAVATQSRHRDLNSFWNFYWSLRLFYIVALSLSRSYTIVACPALRLRIPAPYVYCIIARLPIYSCDMYCGEKSG